MGSSALQSASSGCATLRLHGQRSNSPTPDRGTGPLVPSLPPTIASPPGQVLHQLEESIHNKMRVKWPVPSFYPRPPPLWQACGSVKWWYWHRWLGTGCSKAGPRHHPPHRKEIPSAIPFMRRHGHHCLPSYDTQVGARAARRAAVYAPHTDWNSCGLHNLEVTQRDTIPLCQSARHAPCYRGSNREDTALPAHP
jgi:hypothetical protein